MKPRRLAEAAIRYKPEPFGGNEPKHQANAVRERLDRFNKLVLDIHNPRGYFAVVRIAVPGRSIRLSNFSDQQFRSRLYASMIPPSE